MSAQRANRPFQQENFTDVQPELQAFPQRRAADVTRGALAGAIAGLVAGFVMNEFQNTWNKLKEGREKGPPHSGQHPKQEADRSEDTTVKAAQRISEGIFAHPLSPREKKIAGSALHYAISAISGAAYGGAAVWEPRVRAGYGTGFGTAVWLFADELGVPALGLSRGPLEYPLFTHAYALVSHWVYGVTTEAIYRGILRSFESVD